MNSVSFNSQVECMFCYTGSGDLSVKTDNHLVYQQPLQVSYVLSVERTGKC